MKLKAENVNEVKGRRRNNNKIEIRSREWKIEFT